MKKFNLIYVFPIMILGLFMASCGDDETGNAVTITIEEPTNNETITDCAEVHIHIEIEATEDNHDIEIVLHPEGDTTDKIIDTDIHEHDQLITFEQDVNLCNYPAGTCFHLEVEACVAHDCAEKSTADVEFCLQ